MGDLPKGASVPEVSKELKELVKPKNLETMSIPAAKVEAK
jgi:hypothetical protein